MKKFQEAKQLMSNIVKSETQDAYKLSEDFAKPYFHTCCTEIHAF